MPLVNRWVIEEEWPRQFNLVRSIQLYLDFMFEATLRSKRISLFKLAEQRP